jgi:large subunit ribosomal protein L35
MIMPSIKAKTHKGTKARFKVTGTGKIMHKPCGTSHLNSHMSGNKIRRKRKSRVLNNPAFASKLRIKLLTRNRRYKDRIDVEALAAEIAAAIAETAGSSEVEPAE